MKPKKESINTEQSPKDLETQPFEESILDALTQFRTEGYVKKIKTSITQKSLPSNKDHLLEFLYKRITYT